MQKRKINKSRSAAVIRNKSRVGDIRIIAGRWRGRKLPVHQVTGLRPTTDRNKETLFNWLMHSVSGSRCLDCYAGSGGLGFEALSRGAQQLVLIEQNMAVAQQLIANTAVLQADTAQVIQGDCLVELKKIKEGFDLVFVDPPFYHDLVPATLDRLQQQQLLQDQALVYIEIEADASGLALSTQWQILKQKTSGEVTYSLLRYSKPLNTLSD